MCAARHAYRPNMNTPVVPELTDLFIRFGLALALGLFIGFEREKEKHETFAGIRTFPLISLLGCTAALINDNYVPWIFAVCFVTLSAMIITAYFFSGRQDRSAGITTAVAAYLCFLFGALVWWQLTALAAALAVVTVLLLATKKPLEGLSQKIEGREIAAALQFGVITLIILPVLPNQTFGPLDVINPYTIWLMVVLVAGINFVGYILMKTLGARQGIGLAGLLGGMASSTALTLGFSRRSRTRARVDPGIFVCDCCGVGRDVRPCSDRGLCRTARCGPVAFAAAVLCRGSRAAVLRGAVVPAPQARPSGGNRAATHRAQSV